MINKGFFISFAPRSFPWIAALLAFLWIAAAQAQDQLPIIDMHLHALSAAAQGPPPLALCVPIPDVPLDPALPWSEVFMGMMKSPPCDDPVWSPNTDEELRDQTLSEMERLNIYGLLSGPRVRVAEWKALAPGRIIAGHQFQLGRDDYTPDEVAAYYKGGGFEVLAEVSNQYMGAAPNDPRFEGYWRMAEENDIPVGIHIGTGPPSTAHLYPNYRAVMSSPLLLEGVLARYPKLRVFIMHAGWPMRDDLLALLYAYHHVYVEVGVLQMAIARAEYYDYLETIVRAGFHKRIMFGSDQMVWPGVIEKGIDAINDAPFLTEQQKRDILYNNAARFLRFSDETIARHHRGE